MPETRSRNIILLSDGTGNSAASLFKTNVRRLYDALDLTDPQDPLQPRQFAFYDDGVGTSSFRPLAILGGAFGYGLARNVRELYAFLCRTYRPGDRIYAFGFSRGAFTVRVTVGLITNQGIIRYDGNEATLARNVRDAFRDYRRLRYGWRPATFAWRLARDAVLEIYRRFRKFERYNKSKNHGPKGSPDPVQIEFLGVWDTVDAYGLPIEELTRAVDTVIAPLSMPDANLAPGVKRARHALSLDDQRNTFHPRLWNEADEKDKDRIRQVWFAGVHADVGGGYPEDGLAHVSLRWMMDEIAAIPVGSRLRFHPAVRERQQSLADENAPLHDSRQGLASYYRYKPRNVDALCHQPRTLTRDYEIQVERPRVHQSALRRIKVGQDGYAPISLPKTFDVQLVDGGVADGDTYLGLPPPSRTEFDARQEHVWNFVWWRRVAYFITLIGTLGLASLPLFLAEQACTSKACFLAPVILGLGNVLPGFASVWTHVSASHPITSLIAVAVIVGGTIMGRILDVRIPDEMRRLWYRRTKLCPERHNGPCDFLKPTRPGWLNRQVEMMRRSRPYRHIWSVVARLVLPTAAFALATLLLLGAGNAILLSAIEAWGETCSIARKPPLSEGILETRTFCHSTGLQLENGTSYQIRVTIPRVPGWPAASPWMNGDLPAWPNGVHLKGFRAYMAVLAPFRRHLGQPWFKLMARVGEQGADVYALDWRLRPGGQDDTYEAVLTARRSGVLFLYVNDAAPVVALGRFYDNNKGTATVEVEVSDLAFPSNSPVR